jgi:hypothetical protein
MSRTLFLLFLESAIVFIEFCFLHLILLFIYLLDIFSCIQHVGFCVHLFTLLLSICLCFCSNISIILVHVTVPNVFSPFISLFAAIHTHGQWSLKTVTCLLGAGIWTPALNCAQMQTPPSSAVLAK